MEKQWHFSQDEGKAFLGGIDYKLLTDITIKSSSFEAIGLFLQIKKQHQDIYDLNMNLNLKKKKNSFLLSKTLMLMLIVP